MQKQEGNRRPAANADERRRALLDGVRAGMCREQAAVLAGVSQGTLNHWIGTGRRSASGVCAGFVRELARAEALAEEGIVSAIAAAARGAEVSELKATLDEKGGLKLVMTEKRAAPQWQAAAWMLERRNPERWGKGREAEPERPEETAREIGDMVRDMLGSVPPALPIFPSEDACPPEAETEDEDGRS